MKTKLLISLLLLAVYAGSAQGSSQVFSLSPLSQNVGQVNGVVFGIGHLFGKNGGATINGLNLEINPVAPFLILFQDPGIKAREEVIIVNGIHLSVGGFSGNGYINGLSISGYNIGHATNGFSITGLYNSSDMLNGMHISGILNMCDNGTGFLIAPFNNSKQYYGLNVGVYNNAESFTGVQIGLINRTRSMRGLQLGLWNINEKRSLPFINW